MKFYLINLPVIAVLIVFSQYCYGQNNPEDFGGDYIVKINGDTLTGNVNLAPDWGMNDTWEIYFRHSNEGNEQAFTADQLRSFQIGTEAYFPAEVELEISPFNLDQLDYNSAFELIKQFVILKKVGTFTKPLFYFTNSTGRTYFFIKEDGAYNLLLYKRFLKEEEGEVKVEEKRQFELQLGDYLKACATKGYQLSKTGYNKADLLELFDFYDRCISNTEALTIKKYKKKFEIGILAGPALTNVKILGPSTTYFYNYTYERGVGVMGGVGVSTNVFEKWKRFLINGEFVFTGFKYKRNTEYSLNGIDNHIVEVDFGLAHIKLNTLLRINLLKGNFSPFINFGLSKGFVVWSFNNYYKEVWENGVLQDVIDNSSISHLKLGESGLLFGGGVNLGNYSFEVRAERGMNLLKRRSVNKLRVFRLHAIFSYRFIVNRSRIK